MDKRIETKSQFNSLIVTYNSAGEIAGLLQDLQRLAPSHPIVVIDNASRDSTVEIIKTQFPDVSLTVNQTNVGYSKAVNQGFALCKSEFVFLLNPDIRILDQAFHSSMLECMEESPTIAAVGPLQFIQHGLADRLNFTWSYWSPRAFRIYLSYLFGLKRKFTTPLCVTFLNAGCLLLRKSAFLNVGKLNEKYFLYGEEPDLFLKFKQSKYECRLHPGVWVLHYRERSIKKLPASERFLRKSQAVINISDALWRGCWRLLTTKFFQNDEIP
jgi:N-acetylglucosaminyl-diphospho-decaprenol L-rhamnosyltransferase